MSGSTREQRRALLDRVALAHRQRLDAAVLVGADEDQVGLDPALEAGRRGLSRAGGAAPAQRTERWQTEARSCRTFLRPNSISKCARISERGVERLETVEQPAPDDRHEAGRGQQLRMPHQRVVLELAALRPPGAAGRASPRITRAMTSR